MKTDFLAILLTAAIACSCSPYVTYIPIEMQGPSYTHNFLWNKSIAVTYDESETEGADKFQSQYASGFAKGLQNACSSGGNSMVEVYKLPKADSAEIYNTKLGLMKLVMELDADVVMHIPQTVVTAGQVIQYIYLYDSKSSSDKVYLVKKYGDIPAGSSFEDLIDYANSFGLETALAYQPSWIQEFFPIYSSSMVGSNMEKAYELAQQFEWKKAISLWIPCTKDDNDPEMRSMAAFNMAVGCFFEGQYSLAKEWLDFSDNVSKLPESDDLHKKFALYMN